MKNLFKLITDSESIAAEIAALEKTSAECGKVIERVADKGNGITPKDSADLAAATTRLALVPRQREKLANAAANIRAQLPSAMQEYSNFWSRFVTAHIDEERSRLLDAVKPWFGNRAKAAAVITQAAIVPKFEQLRMAYFADEAAALPGDTKSWIKLARRFIKHTEFYCERFNWKLPESF